MKRRYALSFDFQGWRWYNENMSDIKSSRHARYLLLYHRVWIAKYRRRILVRPLAERLSEVIRHTASLREWDIVAQEIMPDHVHLFVSTTPAISPADMVELFKGVSARILLKEFPDFAQKSGRGTLWAPPYFIR
jgi:putative transposase